MRTMVACFLPNQGTDSHNSKVNLANIMWKLYYQLCAAKDLSFLGKVKKKCSVDSMSMFLAIKEGGE